MTKYIMEAEFLVPHVVRYCVEAPNAKVAMAKFRQAEETSPTFWDGQFEDFDNSRETRFRNVTKEYGQSVETYRAGERADGAG